MEEKAEQRVIERIDLRNGVKGTIVRSLVPTTFANQIVIAFELNGEKYQTLPVEVDHSFVMDRNEWVKKLLEEMSKAIAIQLLIKNGINNLSGF